MVKADGLPKWDQARHSAWVEWSIYLCAGNLVNLGEFIAALTARYNRAVEEANRAMSGAEPLKELKEIKL